MKQLTEDQFYELFEDKILTNHFTKASFNGWLFETYGVEFDYVYARKKDNRIITVIEAEDQIYFVSGYHIVNRLGYFITKEPFNLEFEAKID